MEQLGTQEQVPGSHRAQGLLMVAALEYSSMMVLFPGSSQDLGAELQLQLDLSSLNIFLGIVKSMEHGMQEQVESSDTMEVKVQKLEPETMPSTSWEPSLVFDPLECC
ncbi:hypothetical protein Y1Q_0005279 [Alligator mississippiensis]|uniref:Uncharacterized protein n=1 Tax=Alligator mississippiensis TaxID=8496 RepID=A0A151MT83_ALLMI|nr:hypothetical protein Y1Q_0005279 [Alligator mississippiensis]